MPKVAGVMTIADCEVLLDQIAPRFLAESWDNTGLLLGHADTPLQRIMTCLTITPAVVEEAIGLQIQLILTHHPLPFRPLAQITTASYYGQLVWRLANAGIAVFSLHTRYDSAARGINQQIAEIIGLSNIQALEPPLASGVGGSQVRDFSPQALANPQTLDSTGHPAAAAGPTGSTAGPTGQAVVGRGRWGEFASPCRLDTICARLSAVTGNRQWHTVGERDRPIQRVAIGCGAAGEFLKDARKLACDLLILGETNFHTCLEAEAAGVNLLLTGHFVSEHFAMQSLADTISQHFPKIDVCLSKAETNPVQAFQSGEREFLPR